MPGDPDLLRITVASQSTGETIEGASVIVDQIRYVTDASGTVTINPVPAGTGVLVSAHGHESSRLEVTSDVGQTVTVSLTAVLVLGSVTDAVSGAPVDGAGIVVLDENGAEVASTRTDGSGTFVFKLIPEDSAIVVTHDIYGEDRQRLDDQRSLRIQLDPPTVTGKVVDESGQPVAGASVRSALAETVTGVDGTFTIEGVGQGIELTVEPEGRGSRTVTVSGTDLGVIEIPAAGASPEASPAAAEGEG